MPHTRDVSNSVIESNELLKTAAQRLRPARLVGGGEKPKQKGVVARFAADDVMRIGLAQVVEAWCVGTQRVLEDDHRQVRMVPAKRLEPAACGVAFAVAFAVTVLVNNRLGGQRDHFFQVGMNQRGAPDLMRLGHATAAMVLLQARGTVNPGRGKIAGAIQRQQIMSVEIDEQFQRLATLQAANDITEQRPQVVGIDRIKEGPHLGVAGDLDRRRTRIGQAVEAGANQSEAGISGEILPAAFTKTKIKLAYFFRQ